MDYLVVCISALAAAALTLITGFGLGSLLLPAFAAFFPIPIAVAGAWTLQRAAAFPPLAHYALAGVSRSITPVALIVGLLIIAFALFDSFPIASRTLAPRRSLLLGGLLSGFFGGLSGHQGALRSALLIRLGLSKETFIGTNAVCSVVVDLVRLSVYAAAAGSLLPGTGPAAITPDARRLILAAAAAAFLGSWLAARYIRKISLLIVQRLVAAALLILGAAIALGLI